MFLGTETKTSKIFILNKTWKSWLVSLLPPAWVQFLKLANERAEHKSGFSVASIAVSQDSIAWTLQRQSLAFFTTITQTLHIHILFISGFNESHGNITTTGVPECTH